MTSLHGDAVVRAAFLIALFTGTACSSSDEKNPSHATNLACDETTNPKSTTGYALQPFCSPQDPGPGNIWFAASGEVLALTGYAFPPASDADAAFVDGWDVRFSHLLTTIDKITLSENPDYQKGSQALTGKVVAEVDGPWAVDLSHGDPRYLPGKGGAGEQAVPIAALATQNKNGGEAFSSDGTRYAFGFDVVPAKDDAQNVNLDPEALADYQEMVSAGCAVLYVGTATFKGDASFPGCVTEETKSWPTTVHFRLCFKSPTSYLNCQNPDNDPAKPISDDEESERGIAFLSNSSVIAQVTLHTDHPFWDSVLHDSPAHFDQFAARAVASGSGGSVTLDDTIGVDYTAYTDAQGNAVDWRYCVEPPTDVHPKLIGAMRFDPHGVPSATGSDPATGLRDYYDFATYNQSTQGHLNSDGLCFVRRNYPSPN
ncbi:MAG: hypothetical protein ABW061_26290 [Polyangiaceae bacterium]